MRELKQVRWIILAALAPFQILDKFLRDDLKQRIMHRVIAKARAYKCVLIGFRDP